MQRSIVPENDKRVAQVLGTWAVWPREVNNAHISRTVVCPAGTVDNSPALLVLWFWIAQSALVP
jgi:hypothetical protein